MHFPDLLDPDGPGFRFCRSRKDRAEPQVIGILGGCGHRLFDGMGGFPEHRAIPGHGARLVHCDVALAHVDPFGSNRGRDLRKVIDYEGDMPRKGYGMDLLRKPAHVIRDECLRPQLQNIYPSLHHLRGHPHNIGGPDIS